MKVYATTVNEWTRRGIALYTTDGRERLFISHGVLVDRQKQEPHGGSIYVGQWIKIVEARVNAGVSP